MSIQYQTNYISAGFEYNYIQDLTVSGKLSKHNIEDAKHEQSKILNELKNIQKGLDGIMDDTNDININLKQKNLI